MAMRHDREHQAGANRFIVEQDRAGSAYTMFTTDMRSGQTKVMSQEIAQQQARLDLTFVHCAVHSY
jgi:hypothetical protein